MGLIKSNQLVQQTSGVVVVGDKIVQEATQVIPAAQSKVPDRREVEKPPEVETLPDESVALEILEENEEFEETEGNEGSEEGLSDEGSPEAEDIPPERLIEAFDEEIEEILSERDEASERISAELQGEIGERMNTHLEGIRQETETVVREAHPDEAEAEGILSTMMPYLEHQASAEAEAALVDEATGRRWYEIGTAEEKIRKFLFHYVKEIHAEATFAEKFAHLLLERESILSEARLQAQALVQEAEQRAAQIVAEAESKATQTILDVENHRQDILNELEQQGYAQGYQEGRSQADIEGAEVVSQAIETLNKVRMAYPQAIKDNEEKLLKLAIEIAERIIMEEISIKPEIVQKNLKAAIRKVSDLEHVVIKAHEEDLPILLEKEDQFREMLKNVKNLEFTSSKKIQRGGVVIETSAGNVDAQISTQLSVLKEAFDRVRAEYGPDNSEDAAWEEVDQ